MFSPGLAQVREFFRSSWRKQCNGEVLQGAEQDAARLIQAHPEYHALLNPTQTRGDLQSDGIEWQPQNGQTNPFLHLSLHLAIAEQLSIGQPVGIREIYDKLRVKCCDEHEAQHVLLEALGECLWQAGGDTSRLDPTTYLERVRQSV